MNACWSGWSLPLSAKPSMVLICAPSCITASVRQELILRPLTNTVHAPHAPWSQPFFVPGNPACSRSMSNSDMRLSTVNSRCSPLIWARTTAVWLSSWPWSVRSHPATAGQAATAPPTAREAPTNVLRLSRSRSSTGSANEARGHGTPRDAPSRDPTGRTCFAPRKCYARPHRWHRVGGPVPGLFASRNVLRPSFRRLIRLKHLQFRLVEGGRNLVDGVTGTAAAQGLGDRRRGVLGTEHEALDRTKDRCGGQTDDEQSVDRGLEMRVEARIGALPLDLGAQCGFEAIDPVERDVESGGGDHVIGENLCRTGGAGQAKPHLAVHGLCRGDLMLEEDIDFALDDFALDALA